MTTYRLKSAMVIYFHDISKQINMLKLSLDLLDKEKQNKSLIMNQATMVRRLKQPLFSMLDLCDTLLQSTTDR